MRLYFYLRFKFFCDFWVTYSERLRAAEDGIFTVNPRRERIRSFLAICSQLLKR